MDRALKERIIGATVLVLFVVLIVPVFLDGPANDSEVISQTVPLPGQKGSEDRVIVLHRDRERPEPAASSSSPADDKAPAPVAPEPEANESQPEAPEDDPPVAAEAERVEAAPDEVEKVATAAPAPAETSSSTGMWAVQLGSFSDQANADKLAADLRKQNFTAFLSKLSTGNGELHRVRIGPQKDRESAEKVAEQLAKAGHKGQVVPHP